MRTALITALLAPTLLFAGFAVGWVMAGDGWELTRGEERREASTPPPPPATSPELPARDVSGADISGLPRYPGSVRVAYVRESQGELVWTEVEYLTDARLESVREFYRDVFRTQGWTVGDVGFSQGAWVYFVMDGKREVILELQPRGGLVEVDMEMTEPAPRTARQEASPTPDDADDDVDDAGAEED
ncbi:hypothetical protein Rxycam_02250 [Rubrobacter xylanophilus DSM 9941]|uniref:hypothetical protein n=1 Tax=Rubrobacter xylanophilus TaxID=49319 RepID=UPI001C63E163|nr:hypothetical protein [Rubrobacter xylanophilus]QYJ16417.1 hypothetical protein Rxycam_02250 [Rubrobacter xylanophilus DSM 9941]